MNVQTLLTVRAARYRAVQDRAGVCLRCLDPDAAAVDTATTVETGTDGALTVRVQGPLDDWWGFDVRKLIRQLDEAGPTSIHLLIESPGGFLADGLALYTDLRGRARDDVTVTAEARGVVASAAVLPFLAADERTMATGTMLMVHEPWSYLGLLGSADKIETDVARALQGLRASEQSLRDVLTQRTDQPRPKVSGWLKSETWFSPEEAIAAGLATAAIEEEVELEKDQQARALARRVMASFRLQLQTETL